MKLAPQRQKPCDSRAYMARAYGPYAKQKVMRTAAKRLLEAMKAWK